MSDLGQVTPYFPSTFIRYHEVFMLYEIALDLSKLHLLQNTEVTHAVLVTTFDKVMK